MAIARSGFGARYRQMRARWHEEWWSIAFGGPIAHLLNACIAEIRWITPNALTMLGFALKLAAPLLLVARSFAGDVGAIVALQGAVVLDCMDGSLARYRGAASRLGWFLDKTADATSLVAVFAGVGWRVFLDRGDAAALLVALAVVGTTLLRYYLHWVVAHLERTAGAPATTGVDTRVDARTFTLRQRARRYVASMPRVLGFAETDLYFWISLGLVIGRLREVLYALGAISAAMFVVVLVLRVRTVIRLEARKPR